jgi:hypothetical protein
MKTLTLLTAAHPSKGSNKRTNLLRQARAKAAKAAMAEEGMVATTDVTFVSQSAKAAAIRKGAGVMIGDYFVGVTTGSDLLFSHPVIVY